MTENSYPNRDSGAVPEFTLGDRLRKAREHRGFEIQDLAATIDIHRQTVARYEQGVSTPKRYVLLSWSVATGVSLDWLTTGTAPETTKAQPTGTTV